MGHRPRLSLLCPPPGLSCPFGWACWTEGCPHFCLAAYRPPAHTLHLCPRSSLFKGSPPCQNLPCAGLTGALGTSWQGAAPAIRIAFCSEAPLLPEARASGDSCGRRERCVAGSPCPRSPGDPSGLRLPRRRWLPSPSWYMYSQLWRLDLVLSNELLKEREQCVSHSPAAHRHGSPPTPKSVRLLLPLHLPQTLESALLVFERLPSTPLSTLRHSSQPLPLCSRASFPSPHVPVLDFLGKLFSPPKSPLSGRGTARCPVPGVWCAPA